MINIDNNGLEYDPYVEEDETTSSEVDTDADAEFLRKHQNCMPSV
jgi:hypothetical protein